MVASRLRRLVAIGWTVLLCASAVAHAQQQTSSDDQAAQPTFRAGVNAVRVDVIVSDGSGKPLTGLTAEDFEIFEDGAPQAIEQFRLVDVAAGTGDELPPTELRTRDDELLDAEREDVRVFAFLLDEYHVPQTRSAAVRDALTEFIRTHVAPNDLLTVVYPLTPVRTLTFTRDHASVIQEIRTFTGRKGDYAPRNLVESEHMRNPGAVERIRTEVVLGALSAVSIRLGSLREGRKALILVSDGFAAGYLAMRDVHRDANRHNVSIYPFDPCGLIATPGFSTNARMDCTPSRFRRETLQQLALETDGRAIVNRNTMTEGLAQVARDSSYYYLLGYTSSRTDADGKFHEIRVRVKRRGADVRARRGYWSLTAEEVERAAAARPPVLTQVQRALAAIDIAAEGRRYVRSWVGTTRAADGRPQVTVTWELLPGRDRREWEQPGQLSVMAALPDGTLVSRGGGPVSASPQQVSFAAEPGRLELRLAVESAVNDGETLDREVVTVDVPSFDDGPGVSTPRVYATRTANAFRTLLADATAVPIARREFVRSERLLIRFDAYAAAPASLQVSAAVVNWTGERLTAVPVSAAQAGGTHQVVLPLSGLAPGEYAVEVLAVADGVQKTALVPLRVGN